MECEVKGSGRKMKNSNFSEWEVERRLGRLMVYSGYKMDDKAIFKCKGFKIKKNGLMSKVTFSLNWQEEKG